MGEAPRTPWIIDLDDETVIRDRGGEYICHCNFDSDVETILAAVNAHATLTAALEEARGVLVASRSFVELVYEETDREEAADAKIVMGQTDAALATIDAALGRVEG